MEALLPLSGRNGLRAIADHRLLAQPWAGRRWTTVNGRHHKRPQAVMEVASVGVRVGVPTDVVGYVRSASKSLRTASIKGHDRLERRWSLLRFTPCESEEHSSRTVSAESKQHSSKTIHRKQLPQRRKCETLIENILCGSESVKHYRKESTRQRKCETLIENNLRGSESVKHSLKTVSVEAKVWNSYGKQSLRKRMCETLSENYFRGSECVKHSSNTQAAEAKV